MADIKNLRVKIISPAAYLIVLIGGLHAFGQSAPESAPKTAPPDLGQVPELSLFEAFAKPIDSDKARTQITEAVKHANQLKFDGFVNDLRKNRPDLQGLPFLMGEACRMAEERQRPFAIAGESVHEAISQLRFRAPTENVGAALTNAFQRAYYDGAASGDALPDPTGVGVNMTLPRLAQVALYFQRGIAMKKLAPENIQKPIAAAQIAALMQVLAPEPGNLRVGLAQYLARMPHAEATQALVKLALFSDEVEVRAAACQGLQGRNEKDYTDILLAGLDYPLPAVADRASEAIVQLKRAELLPALVRVLEKPDPRLPREQDIDGKKVLQVRELVRVNHHRNCLLCHAPGNSADIPTSVIKADLLVPGQPFPSHSGYQNQSLDPNFVVRIDVTYLRQDFSRRLRVANATPWPEMQRFDFLVRTRTITPREAQTKRELLSLREARDQSPYHRAALFALRELTGLDTEPTAAAWAKLIAMGSK